jgi:hypothetical protein
VVGRAADRRARRDQPLRRAGQLEPRRVKQREVVEPRVPARPTRVRLLDEDEQLLAAGAERGLARLAALQP